MDDNFLILQRYLLLKMINEIVENVSWLGDPKVTLVSDDGHEFLCHQIILGIYNKNFKSILTNNKMSEYIMLFQSTNYRELKEYIETIYSSFNGLMQHHEETIGFSMNITIMKYTHSDIFDLLGKYLLEIFVAIVMEKN